MRLLLIATLCLLTACGFHLRGSSTLPQTFNPLHLEPGTLSGLQMNLLRRELQRASAQLSTQRESANRLQVSLAEKPLQRLVDSSSGTIALYRLEIQIAFQVKAASGETLVMPKTVSQSVDVELDSTNVLSHEDRMREAREELTSRLIRHMIFQLSRQ